MTTYKKFAKALFALLIFAGSATGLHAQDWMKMSSEKCKCTAEFPTKPKFTDEAKDGYHQYRVMGEVDRNIFLLDYSVHETEGVKVDPMELAEASLEAFAGGVEGETVKRKAWKVGGEEGIKSIVQSSSTGITAYYNVIFLNNIQYQVAVVAEGEPDKKLRKKFLKKFKYKG